MKRRQTDQRSARRIALAIALPLLWTIALATFAERAHAAETVIDPDGSIWRVVPSGEWTLIGSSCPLDVEDLAVELPASDRGVTWQVYAYRAGAYVAATVLDEGEGAWLLQRTGETVRVWVP